MAPYLLSAPPLDERVTYHTHILHLMCADDMALTCAGSDELVRFLTVVDDVCINASKTEVLMAGRLSYLRGGQVQQTSKFNSWVQLSPLTTRLKLM